MDAQIVEELRELVDRHPTYQAARLLLLQGLYQLQDDRFGAALRQAALWVPDRARLFDLIEGEKYRMTPPSSRSLKRPKVEPSTDRTQSLIDSFLSQLTEEPRSRRPHVVDASTDYMSYLLQMDDASTLETEEVDDNPVDELPLDGDSEIFTDGEIRIDDGDSDEWPEEEDKEVENVPSETYFTETLAQIYIKQCKYDKAIEIIRRLSLNYPKKSRYFADQIRFLGKLILNERCKNEEK